MVEKARALALLFHSNQVRKSNGLPYVTHLEETANICSNYGAEDVIVAAAWLHDSIEDQAVDATLIDPQVASIVIEVTERDKSLSWDQRKVEVLEHMSSISHQAAFVKAADVLSNLRGLIRDGFNNPSIWSSFKVSRGKSLWFYGSMVAELGLRGDLPASFMEELSRTWRFVKDNI